jgi:putative cardiolipin synthase
MRLITSLFLALFFIFDASADDVGLLISRDQSHIRRMELIRKETKEIRLSTFIFELDEFGKQTLGLLADAAMRGVKVKLNVDGYMPGVTRDGAILKALEDVGVEVKIFNPTYRNGVSFNYRNHMKSLITSDAMILGDRNMQHSYFKRNSGNSYIGLDAFIEGDEVKEARRHFDSVFESKQMKKPLGFFFSEDTLVAAKRDLQIWRNESLASSTLKKSLNAGIVKVQNIKYVADSPAGILSKNPIGVHNRVLQMIAEAKTSLEFTNPYVLLTPETKKAVEKALDRGVKITINSNSALSTDSHLMGMAWDIHKQELVNMGIEVNELRAGHFLHAKTIVRDGKEVFIGSFNLDPRSQNLNLENGFFAEDEIIAKRVTDYNRRIKRLFMDKVELEVPIKMSASARMSLCAKKGLRKFIVNTVRPML